eukprot:m.211792 g.211792  ORF g.211792 m.211792 type:complete len:210 (+) comp18578_c0_seq11:237-866(+)
MCCGTKTWPGQDIAERGGGMTQTVLTFDYFALLFWRMFRLVAAVVNFVFREPLPGFAGPVPARGPRNPGTEPGKVPVSSQRFDYAAPKDDLASGGGDRSGWHAGNTSRYGHNSRPWAKASSAAAGIVPVASPRSHSLASKVPVTRDEFDAGASLSKPAPAKTDEVCPSTGGFYGLGFMKVCVCACMLCSAAWQPCMYDLAQAWAWVVRS